MSVSVSAPWVAPDLLFPPSADALVAEASVAAFAAFFLAGGCEPMGVPGSKQTSPQGSLSVARFPALERKRAAATDGSVGAGAGNQEAEGGCHGGVEKTDQEKTYQTSG